MKGSDTMKDSLFWADTIANEIATRKKFKYTKNKIKKPKKYVVKSAASVSGVLHIGRLSDTIRCDAVYKALLDAGHKADFIWTADNVDPLRKIPEGVPKSFREYIGVSVTDIPDPWGCHKTYEEHHRSEYLKVVFSFIHEKMKTYSMREEYLKGSFKKEIKLILKHRDLLVEIQNRYRPDDRKLGKDWSPWQPICKGCGKVITPRVTKIREDGKVEYVCKDYDFKTETAKGCGYEGIDDPGKGNGKLMYKGELAAQWAHWNVSTEGFGKEYQVPGSALWINGEIIEKVLKYPMAVPIIYEHLIIEGEKMSASLGNVIYPADWLKVAPAELLRFLYCKKLMKTRSFSWGDLPKLYDDHDRHESLYFGKSKVENVKESSHMKRLYSISQFDVPRTMPTSLPFDFAVTIAQIVPEKDFLTKGIEILTGTGHLKGSVSTNDKKFIKERLLLAKNWAGSYAPERYKFEIQDKPGAKVEGRMKSAVSRFAKVLSGKDLNESEIVNLCFTLSKDNAIETRAFFKTMYNIIINKDFGPRLAPFIISIGQKKVARLLEQV